MFRVFALVLLTLLGSAQARAMMIDKMLLVAKGDSNYFELTNNTETPMFISAQVVEQDISAAGVAEIPYTAKNVAQWKINVNPAKFVLMPNESKVAYINVNKCANDQACKRDKDAVFAINFVPQVYVPEGSEQQSSVGIMFGFAPNFVLLADKQDIDYALDVVTGKEQDQLKVTNTGNTLLTVMVDQCQQSEDKCETYRYVYGGRTASIDLPQRYKKGSLKIKVLNGNETYHKDYVR